MLTLILSIPERPSALTFVSARVAVGISLSSVSPKSFSNGAKTSLIGANTVKGAIVVPCGVRDCDQFIYGQ